MTIRRSEAQIDVNARPESMEQYEEFLRDKTWRMHNLYKIKDKDGKKVVFKPNRAQRQYIKSAHNRNVILKSRQHGFTTLIQIDMLDDCLFIPNTNAGVVAHNKVDAMKFFKDKIKFAYDNLPQHIRGLIPATNDSAQELRFKNGSVISVGTSLRSGTNQRLHISEYGKLCSKYPERADEVKSGTIPTVPVGGRIDVESTADGRAGNFYMMCDESSKTQQAGHDLTALDYKFHFYAWHDDPGNTLEGAVVITAQSQEYFDKLEQQGIELDDGQRAWYVKTAKTQGEHMKREHPSTPEEAFEAAIQGAYFAKQMEQIRIKSQICRVPIEPGIPIHTFWDLGKDTTSIWFFQNVGFDYRFVDYFQNSGEDMAYYLGVLKDRNDGGRSYLYGDMYLPHDGDRKGMADKSPANQLFDNGYSVRIVDRTPDKALSIESARNVLPLCYFDEVNTPEGITCLDGYRKEWDDKLGDWKKTPYHGPESHGADAFMTFADGFHLPIEIEEYEHEHTVRGQNATTGY